ncbi:LptF/LptG family permease, partial [Pelagibacterales bacterium SAG-MED10]|nr:LptF/LptG family permease [Pelagibacterales bacterium SAG-MED10]
MKKILFKKLLSDYLTFFFITLVSTSIVIWVFQAVNFLDIMIEDGRDYLVYINFSLLNFPKILSKVFPFALFFSLFYVTIKYELNNELIILWNFGVHKIKIVNFILKISIILLIFQIILTSFIVPKSQDKARSFLRSSTVNFFDNFIKPQKFNDTIKGVTIYSDKKDKYGNLTNLYLKKEINFNEFQITYAKKGQFKQIGNTPILVLFEGATITSKNNEITNISFSKSDFSLANIETNTTTYKKTQEISSLQLFLCIKNFYQLEKKEFEKNVKSIENCSYKNIQNIIKEFYKRFIIPFYIPLLSLIPFLLITTSKENSNYNKIRTITFLIGLIVIIFSETTIRLISKVSIYDVSIMVVPIVLITFLYLFLANKFNIKINN